MIPPISIPVTVADVPFYSQFQDIQELKWQKVGCGVASLAMVIDYYKPNAPTVEKLLAQGISSGAYDYNAGWKHAGLISLAKKYNLAGNSYDLSSSSMTTAFARLQSDLKNGPVIVSVHYKFDPKSTIPHLVVIDGISNGVVYYNDPAAKSGKLQISIADFQKAWKKKSIVIRDTAKIAVAETDASTDTVSKQSPLAYILRDWMKRFMSGTA